MKRYWLFCIPFILLFLFSLFILGGILLPLTNQQSAASLETTLPEIQDEPIKTNQTVSIEQPAITKPKETPILIEQPDPNEKKETKLEEELNLMQRDRIGSFIIIDSNLSEIRFRVNDKNYGTVRSVCVYYVTHTVYHEETKVMYEIVSNNPKEGVDISINGDLTITPICNPDGTYMIYSPEEES